MIIATAWTTLFFAYHDCSRILLRGPISTNSVDNRQTMKIKLVKKLEYTAHNGHKCVFTKLNLLKKING